MATKEPFQSLEDQTAFESKLEATQKWITDFVCSLGYEPSIVSVEPLIAVNATLRLTVVGAARDTEYAFFFSRRQIEGIADGDLSIRTAATQRIHSAVRRRV